MMARNIWAFVVFNLYAVVLLSSFESNTGYLFDYEKVMRLRSTGLDINPSDWGWGDHYIWRLTSGLIVTWLAGILAGTIAVGRRSLVIAIANIPSVAIWVFLIYLMWSQPNLIPGQTGHMIVAFLAIPATTLVAYWAGGIGGDMQDESFDEGTVLGIRPIHLTWGIVPTSLYSMGLVYVVARFLAIQHHLVDSFSIVSAIIGLLAIVPVFAWGYPIVLVYSILTGGLLAERHASIKALANFGILLVGILLALVVQFVCYWLLDAFASWLTG